MYKQFKTYYIRCRVCGEGKPRSEFEGSWHVCKSCRQKAKAEKKMEENYSDDDEEYL